MTGRIIEVRVMLGVATEPSSVVISKLFVSESVFKKILKMVEMATNNQKFVKKWEGSFKM